MATNPMQRKARNSFLLGMLATLVITGAIIALLFIQLKNYREKEQEEVANSVNVWVLNQNVISGQVITTDMLVQKVMNRNSIPSNAIGNLSILDNYALEDKEGNRVITEYRNNVATLYLSRNGSNYELKTESTGSYYIEVNNQKQYVELVTVPILAKVDMNANTVLTTQLVAKSDEKTTDDLRKQEYNVVVLPSQLETGEYIDIRLSLPSGSEYIVVSKKQVEIPEIAGTYVSDTIWINLTEAEILVMNNAIVDAFRVEGAKLYATSYVEAGIQTASIPTYVPSREVAALISSNPNIITEAKNELINRYNNNANIRNDVINPAISNSGPNGEENVKSKIQESTSNSGLSRKEYLDSLSSNY